MRTEVSTMVRRVTFVATLLVALCVLGLGTGVCQAETALETVDEGKECVVDAQDSILAQGNWGTCLWVLNNEGLLLITAGKGESQEGRTNSPWSDYADDIRTVSFMKIGTDTTTVDGSAAYLFAGLPSLVRVDFTGFDFGGVTSTAYMFAECSGLGRVANMHMDAPGINNTSYMFYKCTNLFSFTNVSMSVSGVADTSFMFSMCQSLGEDVCKCLYVPGTRNMESMFEYCASLKSVNLGSMGVGSVTVVKNLFKGCASLETVDFGGLNTGDVTSFEGMFYGCSSLQNANVGVLDTSSALAMDGMFQECASLSQIDVANYDTSNLVTAYSMFGGCTGASSINVSGWDTSSLQDVTAMFINCTRLASIDVGAWNTSMVTSTRFLFSGCYSLESLDVSSWDTGRVNNTSNMFANCKALESITTGPGYYIKNSDMFPNATASNGMWWSRKDGTWYTKNQIVTSRKNIADTYASASEGQYRVDISGALVTLPQKVYAWTGAAVTPSPKVVLGGRELVEGSDYVVRYANNVDVGTNTARVTVAGKGSYTGSVEVKFSISYDASFKDVSASTAHVEDIIWLSLNNISTGFPDGTFRPGASVARADMAAFLFRLACKWGLVESSWRTHWSMINYIDDVSDSTPHSREIRWLVYTGISKGWEFERGGYNFTEFRPYEKVARQDMAAFLYRLAKLAGRGGASDTWKPTAEASRIFADVDAESTSNHHEEVWWLAQTGVSEGWKVAGGKREFRGLRPVARQDMAAFLHRLDLLR